MTKRIFLFIWFCVSAIFCTFAQEMSVRSMSHRERDLSARSHVRNDLNGEPCALIRVEFPLEDVVFDGNIVGDVERHVNEYWVYLTAGSKWLEIRHPKLYSLEVLFPDYNISQVEGLQTYKLVVLAPLLVASEPQEKTERPLPVKEEKVVIAKEETKEKKENIENGHEYVDLGLPSGLLWATCNVGAAKPEDYGDYFAWGATKSQSVYDWAHTPYQTQNTTYSSKTKYTKYLGSMTSGYKDSSAKDSDALKTVLDPEDDAAHVNWGGSWRMPTRAEQDELRDTNNCTWTWTTRNGVKGYEVTSKKNGNTLFLPAAGYRGISSLGSAGSNGYYWSSSLGSSSAYGLAFYSSYVDWGSGYRYYGRSVRPVCTSSK